jgi:CheY-like chemotaxis protein
MAMINTAERNRKALKILIADDDPAIVKVLASRCADIGFEVETATNGVSALLMARRRQPDILIVDVNMPELDGLSLCAKLLAPDSKSIDVIVVTGSDDPETELRCESMGTFYGSKRSNFWNSIAIALGEIAPEMADRIKKLEPDVIRGGVTIRPRVLVVDDDPDINIFLSSRLAKFDVETLYAADAEHGIKIALRDKPSVIICDYFMPNGDASYFLAKLRSMPETANTPVIVLSGRRLDDNTKRSLTRETAGRPGAAKVLEKSMDTEDLFEFLQKFVGFHCRTVQE